MSKVKLLVLTSVTTEINEKGQKKLDKVNKKQVSFDEDNPPEGTVEWFRKLGIKPPKDLEEDTPIVDKNGMMELEEDEVEYIHNEVIIDRSDFSTAIDTSDGLTTVYTKSGVIIDVIEDTDDIYAQIFLLDQSWFDKNWEDLKWRIKKIFKKKEKDLIL